MTNRIGPVDHSLIGKLGNKAEETGTVRTLARNPAASDNVASSQAPGNDTVELTSSAKLLERLEKTLGAFPEVDSARVAEVKSAIENGNYEIDANAIADAMLKFERSLAD